MTDYQRIVENSEMEILGSIDEKLKKNRLMTGSIAPFFDV